MKALEFWLELQRLLRMSHLDGRVEWVATHRAPSYFQITLYIRAAIWVDDMCYSVDESTVEDCQVSPKLFAQEAFDRVIDSRSAADAK